MYSIPVVYECRFLMIADQRDKMPQLSIILRLFVHKAQFVVMTDSKSKT